MLAPTPIVGSRGGGVVHHRVVNVNIHGGDTGHVRHVVKQVLNEGGYIGTAELDASAASFFGTQ